MLAFIYIVACNSQHAGHANNKSREPACGRFQNDFQIIRGVMQKYYELTSMPS